MFVSIKSKRRQLVPVSTSTSACTCKSLYASPRLERLLEALIVVACEFSRLVSVISTALITLFRHITKIVSQHGFIGDEVVNRPMWVLFRPMVLHILCCFVGRFIFPEQLLSGLRIEKVHCLLCALVDEVVRWTANNF